MNIFTVMTALGTSLPLASRAFVPLFMVSLLSNPGFHRVCPSWLQGLCLQPPETLSWIGSPYFLLGVGILALLECLADKSDDIKELLQKSQIFLKTAVSLLVALALVPEATRDVISPVAMPAGLGLGNYTAAVLAATATYFVAKWRSRFYEAWFDADEEDDFGLRFLVSFFEDLWAFIAVPLFILLPLLTAFLVIVLFSMLAGGRWILGHLDDRRRAPCTQCGAMVLPGASRCCGCQAVRTPATILTWKILPGRRQAAAESGWSEDLRQNHQLRLIARRRCPACAEKVRTASLLRDGCNVCGFHFDDLQWFERYRSAVIARAVCMLVPVLLISWIPVIGIAVAIVLVKVYLTSPLRMFLGHGRRFLLKWGMRVLTAILLLGGSFPLVSIAAVPILIGANILVYGFFAKRTIAAKLSRDK